MVKFTGSIDDLKSLISNHSIKGAWSEKDNMYSFKGEDGGVINWWPKTKTLQIQGNKDSRNKLEQLFINENSTSKPTSSNSSHDLRRQEPTIFVVSGHDIKAREELELVLRRLGLNPYILQNNDGESKTIIEALERRIFNESDFGIVLMTPDDFGYPKDKSDSERKPRARQNVIFEMGMLIAALSRDNIAILKKGNLEIPSDIDGIIRLEFNEHVKEVAVALANRIKATGIHINPDSISKCAA